MNSRRHRSASTAAAIAAAALLALQALATGHAAAQQQPQAPSPWSAGVTTPPIQPPGNTTVVPRAAGEPKTATAATGQPLTTLVAVLTEDGQPIEQGMTWRVFEAKPGADGKHRLVSSSREAAPALKLSPGDYLVNVAFGRANLTRKITIKPDQTATETFVLNAGGLKVIGQLVGGGIAPPGTMSLDIYSDERDQSGNRLPVFSGIKPGLIIRLNAGIYHIVSTFGDANAVVRSDVTVEAGKLTEATVRHAIAKVTFRLVNRPGGEALADTQWSITTPQGEVVKESAGALPAHTLAPGTYSAVARHGDKTFRSDFMVKAGDQVYVEVVAR